MLKDAEVFISKLNLLNGDSDTKRMMSLAQHNELFIPWLQLHWLGFFRDVTQENFHYTNLNSLVLRSWDEYVEASHNAELSDHYGAVMSILQMSYPDYVEDCEEVVSLVPDSLFEQSDIERLRRTVSLIIDDLSKNR